ncbi:aspartate kinase [Desulfobacca acetoxidans]|uniref:Aspartokinase n=1 Tax=Desulfobacca acetoxidans (strain ATCC 700848 / DSM 11109 / ASRB2) TaxID=880072 RepID=F2NFN7_DESAR|nr:aspartate kinase [Desulfobacca acetoxidans]AEB10156.1 aspartate kinase [Desulfobacca acetoxidans DSM 11109]HAY22911.1 aspartate kinase [Desulfobacterales bacterium]
MPLIVQKYGGTSVGSPDRIANVANRVVKEWRQGKKMVVVLSAMSGETDRLIKLGKELAEFPDPRELDVLMATGEQVTVSLFSIYLKSQGIPATSLLSHQARIYTDRAYGRARIIGIDTARIREELKKGRIVTVAGFQGVDEVGNITTLGRGGSDTTAVAIAAALKADLCEIYTDVEGVFTTDPRICPKARKLDKISYDEMLEMASLGAKVLEIRSVGFAKRYNVRLAVRSSFSDHPGTLVTTEDEDMENILVSGVAYSKNDARVTITRLPDRPGIASRLFNKIAESNIVVDMIIQNTSIDGMADITFTVPKGDLRKTLEIIQPLIDELGGGHISSDENIAKVSIVGVGMRNNAGVAAKMFSSLARENINIMMISTSEIKVSCIIEDKYTELAVRTLHDAFGLEQSRPRGELT